MKAHDYQLKNRAWLLADHTKSAGLAHIICSIQNALLKGEFYALLCHYITVFYHSDKYFINC